MASMLARFKSSGFYLWGHLVTLAYAASADNEEALHNHIVDACKTIHNYSSIFEWMQQPMMGTLRCALNLAEDTLGTYYRCTLSSITRKLNVS
jgi:hypothetical protein